MNAFLRNDKELENTSKNQPILSMVFNAFSSDRKVTVENYSVALEI